MAQTIFSHGLTTAFSSMALSSLSCTQVNHPKKLFHLQSTRLGQHFKSTSPNPLNSLHSREYLRITPANPSKSSGPYGPQSSSLRMLLSRFFSFIKTRLQLNPSLNTHWVQLGFFYLRNLSLTVYTAHLGFILVLLAILHPTLSAFLAKVFTPLKAKWNPIFLLMCSLEFIPPLDIIYPNCRAFMSLLFIQCVLLIYSSLTCPLKLSQSLSTP